MLYQYYYPSNLNYNKPNPKKCKLIYVSILMLGGMEMLNWSKTSDLLPALIIIVMIPLTFSIADGIALGFLSYIALKVGTGEISKISSGAWFLTLIFLSKFIFL